VNPAPNDTEPLFAYGTLLDAAIQISLFGHRCQGVADSLLGYIKTEVNLDGEWYPNLTPAPDRRTAGQVLYLTRNQLARADEYESDDYQRIQVILESGQTAWLYIANPSES